jgi:hypothetical protein
LPLMAEPVSLQECNLRIFINNSPTSCGKQTVRCSPFHR